MRAGTVVPRRALPMFLAVLLTACTAAVRVETPDPGSIPTGPPTAQGEPASGPIVEVGSGQVSGIGWRHLAYPSAAGWCVQFETVAAASTACGGELPPEGQALGGVSEIDVPGAPLRPIAGFASPEVATVWLINEDDGTRVPALLTSLDEAGVEALGFIGFAPEGRTITHLQAMRLNGEVLETYPLP